MSRAGTAGAARATPHREARGSDRLRRPYHRRIYLPLSDAQREALEISERFVPGPEGAPDVRVLVYRPRDASGTLPVLLHIHGGGFVMLHPESFAGMEAQWSLDFRCVVVSIDYRLAPEHPFPAAPEDCYAVLLWTVANADELGIDPDRLVVTGGSAGGALSAALCLMTRDRGGPRIAYQALMIPATKASSTRCA